MRVGLVISGLDHAYRGYETFTAELFAALSSYSAFSSHIEVDLIKGSGSSSSNQIPIPCLRRDANLYKWLEPIWQSTMDDRFLYEERTFSNSILPTLLRRKYDVLLCSQPGVTGRLVKLRKWFHLSFKIVFSNSGPFTPNVYQSYDAIHQVTPITYQQGLAAGIFPERMFQIPFGFFTDQYNRDRFNREFLRQKYQIPQSSFVVLCAAAISSRKNISYLLQEFSKLNSSQCYLLISGQFETETAILQQQAQSLLADNWQFIMVPPSQMPELYALSDLLVHPALFEGFGRVLAESMAANLALLHHPDLIMNWVVNNPECQVDMTQPTVLSNRIKKLIEIPEINRRIARQNQSQVKRFDWQELVKSYIRMFETVIL